MQHLQKTGGWGTPPFDALTPIPANVSNVLPIYPLCFHILVALTDSTALEQLFSNQPITQSFRRDGGCTPSRPLPIFSGSISRPQRFDRGSQPCRKEQVFRQSPVTSHQSRVNASPCPQRDSRLHPPSCILSPGHPPLFRPGDCPLPLSWRSS